MRFRTKLAIWFGCGGMGILLLIFWRMPVYQQAQKPQDAEAAIKQLSSPEIVERSQAKRKLLELGPNAVGPLVTYLEDLTRYPGTHFSLGREKEAEKALEDYDHRINVGEKIDPNETRELMSLLITDRLTKDVISLLEQLHAVEAVPLLIEIMWEDDIIGSTEHMSPSMRALKEIGAEAVTELMEAMESADAKVSSVRQEESEFRRRMDIFCLQARGAMVLGQIGDQRALPLLERLQEQTDDKVLLPYLKDAITEIKRRSGAEELRGNKSARADHQEN